jgi:hypothetical protein
MTALNGYRSVRLPLLWIPLLQKLISLEVHDECQRAVLKGRAVGHRDFRNGRDNDSHSAQRCGLAREDRSPDYYSDDSDEDEDEDEDEESNDGIMWESLLLGRPVDLIKEICCPVKEEPMLRSEVHDKSSPRTNLKQQMYRTVNVAASLSC